MTEYDGMESYDITKAFSFLKIGDNVSNEVIMDYMELVWCFYFAIIFGFLGSKLERASAFVYNMRIFGFYEVWLMLRTNPVYLSGAFLDSLFRCLAASLMAALAQKMYKAGSVVQGWTIVTVASSYTIIVLDPWLRSQAGCDSMAGPPSVDFPHGVWLDCDDWRMAYGITWFYSSATYILVAITGCLAYIIRNNTTIIRLAGQVSVAMVATSSATTATRAFIRRMSIDTEFANSFVDYCFYIFVVFFFLIQEAIYRITKNCSCIKYCLKLWKCIILVFGGPLIFIEWGIKKIEQRVVDMNKDPENEENAMISKGSDL